MTDKLQIQIPEGYEIDTFDLKTGLVTFKKKLSERWRDKYDVKIRQHYLIAQDGIHPYEADCRTIKDKLAFPTEKQAQSVYAFSELSKIIANDPRFGGPITDKEWLTTDIKYVIYRTDNKLYSGRVYSSYAFLAFHTAEQRDLFLKENEDLIKQYFML